VRFVKPHPLIALDVDGVLLPFGPCSGEPIYALQGSGVVTPEAQEAVKVLLSLNVEMRWFTTWGARAANSTFGELLGMRKPLKGVPSTSSEMGMSSAVDQKAEAASEFLKFRPWRELIILDDQVTSMHHRMHVIQVDSHTGLQMAHVDEVTKVLKRLRDSSLR